MIRCHILDLDKSTYLSMYMPQIPNKGDKINLNRNVFFVHEITYTVYNEHCQGIEIGVRSEASVNSF